MEIELKKMYFKAKNSSLLCDKNYNPFESTQNNISNAFDSHKLLSKINFVQFDDNKTSKSNSIRKTINNRISKKIKAVRNIPKSVKFFQNSYQNDLEKGQTYFSIQLFKQKDKLNQQKQQNSEQFNQNPEYKNLNTEELNQNFYSEIIEKYLKQAKNKKGFKKQLVKNRDLIIQQAIQYITKQTKEQENSKFYKKKADAEILQKSQQRLKNKGKKKISLRSESLYNFQNHHAIKKQKIGQNQKKKQNESTSTQLPQIQTKPSISLKKKVITFNTQQKFFINEIKQLKETQKKQTKERFLLRRKPFQHN